MAVGHKTYSPILAAAWETGSGLVPAASLASHRITAFWAVISVQLGSTGIIEVKKGLIYLVLAPNQGWTAFFQK
ncbi:hypothetical protein J25TS5_33980 [Paenibacillus faecis]|nr:hypothetical protein J25TS5_33980 [Paenibacillus faecis]